MKRIALFLHGGIAPPGSGFDIPTLTGLVRRLADRFDLTVYQLSGDRGTAEGTMCGSATVHSVRASHRDHLSRKISAMVRMFRRHHEQHPFDLAHGLWALPGGMAAVLAGKRYGIPSVVGVLGGEAACLPAIGYGNMRKPSSRIATLWTLRQADAVVCLTRTQLDHLRSFGFTREENVHIIPFGPEASFFSVLPRDYDAPPLNILHVGSLNNVKDQGTLLRAFQHINREMDSHLRIVGVDTLGGVVHRYVRELGMSDHVSFTGYVPHDELPQHYGWAHLLMQTSLYEGQGIVFAEAAAAGVPICGTRVGLLADLGEKFAATANPGDADGLAGAALRSMGDGALRDRRRAFARAWAGEHRGEEVAQRYERLYRDLIHARI